MTTSWDELPVTLTVREVCRIKRLSRNAVYEMVRRHEIPHEHYGRAIRIDRDALRRGDRPNHTHPDTASVVLSSRPVLAPPRRCNRKAAGR